MEPSAVAVHLAAGEAYGRAATCGEKVRYPTEERAAASANALNRSPKRHHEVEAYPCVFCGEWHVGRKMTVEEWERFGGASDVV